ncbi:MAG: L-malate glycosyltransferase, partial [Clostridium butyricum]|nr:L-malate glycosyltransferase [Clostridium butyricum]
MKLLVMSDAHIVKDKKKGKYWCRTAVHGYDFWKRYLDVFDEVNVVARVQQVDSVNEEIYALAEGPNVKFT